MNVSIKYINMQFFTHAVFIVFIIQKNIKSETQSFIDIHKFVIELRNDSISMAEYVAEIQAVFCPDQPFCGELAKKTRQDVMNMLPVTLNVNNNTIAVDQLQALTGICCFPCSCEDTCRVDNNCCLTKEFENKTKEVKMESKTNSDCIASVSRSFQQKDFNSNSYLNYFMITKCFFETAVSIKSHCETPNPYDMADIIPVTSLNNGRIYWNQHCAKCNGDTENVVFWNMTVVFKNDFAFYRNSRTTPYNLDDKEKFYYQLLKHIDIAYNPPFQMPHKRCIQPELQKPCRKSRDDIPESEHQFLYETCNMFTSTVVARNTKQIPRRNIFCYICDEETFTSDDKTECSFIVSRHPTETMTGLLKYNNVGQQESSTNVELNEIGKCLCAEIYDKYQERCRPVYCPPGSLFSGCHCSELLEAVFGMPVLLKFKVRPEPGSKFPSTDALAAKFRKTLQKAVQNTIGHISADIVSSFRQENGTNSFQLFAVIIRSNFGHDTKETLRPLLGYVDADVFLKITSSKNRYLVGLGNKIKLRSVNNQLVSAFDLQTQRELVLDYSSIAYYGSYGMGIYQEFSPILFCKQVQFDNSQCTEKNGQIFINATSSVLTVSDFYRTVSKDVRVCLDQYLPSCGNSKGHVMMSLIIVCTVYHRL